MNVTQNEHSTLVEYFPCLGKEEEKKENYTFSFGSFFLGWGNANNKLCDKHLEKVAYNKYLGFELNVLLLRSQGHVSLEMASRGESESE